MRLVNQIMFILQNLLNLPRISANSVTQKTTLLQKLLEVIKL